MLIAVIRPLSPSFARAELTHLARQPIDVARAAGEHAAYVGALRSLGVCVIQAPAAPDLPDAVFVEDVALVLDEVAVIARPGAASRRPETESIAAVLGQHRPLLHIEGPATLDGGDVLRVGRTLYVGQSTRTNREAVDQLGALLGQWDYRIVPVEVNDCLHLKSAVTLVGDGLLLANPDWVPTDVFAPLEAVAVAGSEPHAANALLVRGSVIYPAHFPRTAERLERAGIQVARTPCSEIAKAEGGVTCCSLVFES